MINKNSLAYAIFKANIFCGQNGISYENAEKIAAIAKAEIFSKIILQTKECREAFESRHTPNLDLKRNKDGNYHYQVTQMAFRDFEDGWNAKTVKIKGK